MLGYLGISERPEWFFTGNLGYVDADGFVFIVNRNTDLIIKSGFKIIPRRLKTSSAKSPASPTSRSSGRTTT